MKKTILASCIIAALTGCGTTTPQKTVSEWRQGAEQVDITIAPQWFTEYKVTDDQYIFAVATEYSSDLQFAIDKANLSAKRQIAAQMDSTISSMMKDFASESGTAGSSDVMREVDRTTRQVTAQASIIGFKRDKFEIRREGKGYRVYSRMLFPYDDTNKLMVEAIKRNKTLQHSFNKSEAFRELDHHTGTKSYESKARPTGKSVEERAQELPHNTISDQKVKKQVEDAIARGDAVIMTHTVN